MDVRIGIVVLRVVCVAIAVMAQSVRATELSAKPDGDRVIAIDVLLEPDAVMARKAIAANALLRENYSKCYTLGHEQAPHITLVHRYVREKDLPAIESAVSKVAAAAKPLNWELTAPGYSYAMWAGVAITSIGVERTPKLDQLQDDIVKVVEPFAVPNGNAAAFSTSRELPKIEPEIVSYVAKFVPNSSGKKYNPHVTIGVAHEDFVKRLKAEPFKPFKFRPAKVAIYQLGSFGTAQKKLWEWSERTP